MTDFSVEIDQFVKYGTYEYRFDEAGNIPLNPSSPDFNRNYVSVPLQNFNFRANKIMSYYDVNLTEFVPTTPEEQVSVSVSKEFQDELDNLKAENQSLTEQLNTVIESSSDDMSAAERDAVKEVIIELRKKLGEGRVGSDFSEDFPYTAIIKSNTD